jgi:kynurenine formamidase
VDQRLQFDFEIEFSNGGGLRGRDFRLDVERTDIGDDELAARLVADMRLLMVGNVRIANRRVVSEAHKRRDDASRHVDLSHVIENGMPTHRGLPAPVICDFLSREASRERYAPGTEFQIAKIDMVANTGTYVDVPSHRYADGRDLAQVGIDAFAGIDALVVRIDPERTAIDADAFAGLDVRGRAVLVHTGWDRHWRTPEYFGVHPFLTENAAVALRDRGARLVGIDSMNIDDTRGNTRPAHTILLGAEIVIAEHLCRLERLPDYGFAFTAVPPKVVGVGTFPVRAYATLR